MARKHFNPMAEHMDSQRSSQREVRDIFYENIASETEKAYCFVINGSRCWLPKSQVELYESDKVVVVPEWLCAENDL